MSSIVLCAVLVSCNQEEVTPQECILETLQFDPLYRLEFRTLSGGRIYEIKQYFDFEGESKVVASFSFDYFKDSLAVRDRINASNYKYPFLTATYADDRLKQVVKYFPQSEIRLIHDLSYPASDQIKVDLTRVASNGDRLYAAYGLYDLNQNGNVVRVQRFGIDESNRERMVLYDEIVYTYDDYLSPVDNLFLPFFTETNVPDARFFSKNNIVSEIINGVEQSYSYEYGANRSISTQTPPNGPSVYFEFVNCD